MMNPGLEPTPPAASVPPVIPATSSGPAGASPGNGRGRSLGVVIALFVLTLGGVAALLSGVLRPPTAPDLGALQILDVPEPGHVAGRVDYPQNPPAGGLHAAVWQNCGFYSAPVPAEQAVHSMEHGAVWITYSPDLPADQVAVLEGLAAAGTHILISPFPDGLPAPVVATAWGRQQYMASASDPNLDRFVAAYHRGPQTPEPDGPCVDGEGVPK
ncbi:MAG: DUF3105 domain-containing protein [Acidimicrobiales bacterium]